jgi:hypothetical protein
MISKDNKAKAIALTQVNVIYTAQNIKVDQPVIFKLTQHIQPIDTSKITISPATEGS